MGKIKIGIGILTAITLIGLVLGLVVFANPSDKKDSDNDKADYALGQIIVKFKGDVEPFRVMKVPEGKVTEKIKEYQAKTDVIYAEPDYFVYALGSNDGYYGNQWALNNTRQEIFNKQVLDCMGGNTGKRDYCCAQENAICFQGSYDADVDWDEAFGAEILGNTVVAIVDSGIDLKIGDGSEFPGHPDLRDKIIAGWDFVDEDNVPQDICGHGTHVSGIATAVTNNDIGIAGIAFSNNIKIMPIRVLDKDCVGTVSNVAKGIRYAAENGANVINLSLGRKFSSTTLKDAVDYAWNKGMVLAAAAGNDGNGGKYYPASYPNVISVAATDYNDKKASFSNFNDEIDISAPGVNVFSTFPTYEFTIGTKYGRSQNYDVGSGTSMSVPHVVGLAGLLFAQDINRDNVKVRAIIEETADNLGASGWDKYFGWGRINVSKALNYVPTVCGDGIKEGTEECDGKDLGGTTCESLGFTGGDLSCTASCTFDTSVCTTPTCIVVPGECNCNGKCGPNETLGCADCL